MDAQKIRKQAPHGDELVQAPHPSERVIDLHREQFGTENRLQPEGEHPAARMRVNV